jgi:hypothetical protein
VSPKLILMLRTYIRNVDLLFESLFAQINILTNVHIYCLFRFDFKTSHICYFVQLTVVEILLNDSHVCVCVCMNIVLNTACTGALNYFPD